MSLIEKRTEREATFGDLTGKFTYTKTYTYINFKNTFPFSWLYFLFSCLYNSYYLFRYCLLKLKITKTAPVNDFILNFGYKYQKIIKKIKKMFNKNIDDFDILSSDSCTCKVCHKSFKDDVFCEFMVNVGYADEMGYCRECCCKKYGIKNTYKDIVEFLENNRGGILFYIHEKEYEKQYKYIEYKKYKMIKETTVNNVFGGVVKEYNSLESSFFNKIQL